SNYYYVMATVDLTPFGFTPTESVVYSALLRLGPATGYGVSRATRLARANAYAALAGLVDRGAAYRTAGRPVQYRPTDPQALLAHLAAQQGEALDRLSRALENASQPREPETRVVADARAVCDARRRVPCGADSGRRAVPGRHAIHGALPSARRHQGPLRGCGGGDRGDLHPRAGGVSVRLAEKPRPRDGGGIPSGGIRQSGLRLLRQTGARVHERRLCTPRGRIDGLPAPPRCRARGPLDGGRG